MTALLLLASLPPALWLGQTALLLATGRRPQWALSGAELPANLKSANRVWLYVCLAAVVVAYPDLRGATPSAYYLTLLPAEAAQLAARGVFLALLFLLPLFAVWSFSDNVRFGVRHGVRNLLRRLLPVPAMAVCAAFMEELVFRAILLEDLLTWLPPLLDAALPSEPHASSTTGASPHALRGGPALSRGAWAAVALGALIFAGAHYLRKVKRYWTFPGHLALGLLFCTAYATTRNLWLSLGLHAGGILVIMAARPMVRYVGPGWLVGASIFPYAGVPGVAALLLLNWLIVQHS